MNKCQLEKTLTDNANLNDSFIVNKVQLFDIYFDIAN